MNNNENNPALETPPKRQRIDVVSMDIDTEQETKDLLAELIPALKKYGTYTTDMVPYCYHAVKPLLESKLKMPVVSKSSLSFFMKDPYGYRWAALSGETRKTDALSKGALIDCIALTPELVHNFYAVVDAPDKRGKTWKDSAAAAEKEGREPVLLKEYEAACRISRKVTEALEKHYPDGYTEQTGMWAIVENVGGVPLETPVILTGMIDILPFNENLPICDLKTTSFPLYSEDALNRNIYEYAYTLQAAIYSDLYQATGGTDRGFELLFTSVAEPTRTRFVRINPREIAAARLRYTEGLRNYAYAWKHDEWGHTELPDMEYEPPAWSKKKEEKL